MTDHESTLPGIELVEVADGRATASLVVGESMLNSHGACHGGVIFTLADTAMEHATNSDGSMSVAIHAEVDYVRPAQLDDRLIATASIVQAWGRTKLVDSVVETDPGGVVIAHFRGRTRATAR